MVDEALCIFGPGELLFEVRESKTGVDALAQDAAEMIIALDDDDVGSRFVRCECGSHACGTSSDDSDVKVARWDASHLSALLECAVDNP